MGAFHNDDLSIDEFSKIAPNNSGKTKRRSDKILVPRTEKKRTGLSIHTDGVFLPQNTAKLGVKPSDVLAQQALVGNATTTSKHAQKAIENRRNSALSPKVDESHKAL